MHTQTASLGEHKPAHAVTRQQPGANVIKLFLSVIYGFSY